MLRAVTAIAILSAALPAFADDDRLELGASLVRGSRLRAGEVEVSGPAFGARYGLTDDTTVGADAWPLLGFAGGGAGIALALDRHGDLGGRWHWDIGATGAYFDYHPNSLGLQLRGLAAHANLEWRTRRNALGLAAIAGGMTVRQFSDSRVPGAYAGIHVEGAGVVGSYAASPWRWLAIELLLGELPYVAVATDGTAGMDIPDIPSNPLYHLVTGLHIHVRAGHWRTSLGATVTTFALPVPSLTIARKW